MLEDHTSTIKGDDVMSHGGPTHTRGGGGGGDGVQPDDHNQKPPPPPPSSTYACWASAACVWAEDSFCSPSTTLKQTGRQTNK